MGDIMDIITGILVPFVILISGFFLKRLTSLNADLNNLWREFMDYKTYVSNTYMSKSDTKEMFSDFKEYLMEMKKEITERLTAIENEIRKKADREELRRLNNEDRSGR